MRTDDVVNVLPVAQLAIELFYLQGTGSDLIELLGVGAVGTFDSAVAQGSAIACLIRSW